MAPNHQSALSDLIGSYNFMSTQQYSQMLDQLQLVYPTLVYPFSFKSTDYPSPPIDDSLESGIRVDGKEKKTRKLRTEFSSLQLQQLDCWFQRSYYLNYSENAELAASIGLDQIQVENWFQNRRRFKCQAALASSSDSSQQDAGSGASVMRINGGKVKKIRKIRTIYSSLQSQQLNHWFQRNQFPNSLERAELALSLGLAVSQMDNWFKSRRSERRKMLKAAPEVGGKGYLPLSHLGDNTDLGDQQHQEIGSYGQLPNSQPVSPHQVGGHHLSVLQQMGEVVAAANYQPYNWQYHWQYAASIN